jgi:hypothetical protein
MFRFGGRCSEFPTLPPVVEIPFFGINLAGALCGEDRALGSSVGFLVFPQERQTRKWRSLECYQAVGLYDEMVITPLIRTGSVQRVRKSYTDLVYS